LQSFVIRFQIRTGCTTCQSGGALTQARNQLWTPGGEASLCLT